MLIDGRSGRSAQLAGYPVPSADGRHFVAASLDLTAGLLPNVVEIWSATSEGFRRDALFKPEWGPHSATWLDAARVEVSKVCLQPTEQNPVALKPCGTVRIVKDGRRWRMGD